LATVARAQASCTWTVWAGLAGDWAQALLARARTRVDKNLVMGQSESKRARRHGRWPVPQARDSDAPGWRARRRVRAERGPDRALGRRQGQRMRRGLGQAQAVAGWQAGPATGHEAPGAAQRRIGRGLLGAVVV